MCVAKGLNSLATTMNKVVCGVDWSAYWEFCHEWCSLLPKSPQCSTSSSFKKLSELLNLLKQNSLYRTDESHKGRECL